MPLYELHEELALDAPVLVTGLEGFIDAGGAAATAVSALTDAYVLSKVATFDTDVLLDFRSRRPTVNLVDGVNTGLTWPTVDLFAGHDRHGHDLMLLVGAEPDHCWHQFAHEVVDLAVQAGCRMLVGLGAYPAPTPHTRPSRLASTASSAELADQVGFIRGSLQVPGAVQGAFEEAAAKVGLPAVGLWSQVPHYAAAMPYPGAAVSLLEGLHQVTGLATDPRSLREAEQAARIRIDGLVANSDEHVTMVRRLEAGYDAEVAERATGGSDTPSMLDEPIPSGDELAAEFERFLRDQE